MATSQHLQIINPSYCGGEDVLFSLFPKLPTELRLRIWRLSVERHRLIEVEVEALPDSGDDAHRPPYSTTNALNKLISSRNYAVTVQGFRLHSKLLRVNSESRKEALRFYRVHIPCYLRASRRVERSIKSTLYFNPEYDFIQLEAGGPVETTFVDFLHDIRAYDPRDAGLVNLAIDSNGMNVMHSSTMSSEGPARAAFVDFLSQLREVIWVAQSIAGRAILGPLQI